MQDVFWTVQDIATDSTGRRTHVTDLKATKAGGPQRTDKKRSAKTAALTSISKSSTPQPSVPPPPVKPPLVLDVPGPKFNGSRQAGAQPATPLFDLTSVCTSAPRIPPPRTRPRLFGLEHCPIFYPTVEEFMRPMEYIEKIARETSQEHGIAKIVPPEGWRPPFALDTRSFRFRTRLQRLNSMEASARANVNFLEQLYLFHRQQGSSRIAVPIVNAKSVDLWRLRRETNRLGGYRAVTDARQWPQVAKAMGFDIGVAVEIQSAFRDVIVPFEDYLAKAKTVGANGSSASTAAPRTSMRMGAAGTTVPAGSNTSQVSLERMQHASTKLSQALSAEVGAGPGPDLDKALDEASEPNLTDARVALEPGDACELCQRDHDHASILLCDGCDRAYHMSCLDPPLVTIPKGQWICDACIVSTGGDYGFEEGDEHTLQSYRRRGDAFKKMWLTHHPAPPFTNPVSPARAVKAPTPMLTNASWIKPDVVVPPLRKREPSFDENSGSETPATQPDPLPEAAQEPELSWEERIHIEDHMEREFWRLVESQHETVEVEYGADLHSTKYGSAFPALDRHPIEPYARDGWNLNNLPVMSGSLLRFVKSDISGMTNPWIYVGMAFSTFAWHKEDHYTYSINYHHIGETKTWYGVPGADDEKLEAAMKTAAPELFEQQPDLMFQLVTLMSPGRLKKAGVRVAACDQRPGEFVLTFPKAYHAGFNQGVNLCEAVNFCLPDWLPHGLDCVKHYQQFNKHPVFSHDELLVTVAAYEKGPVASRWLHPHFKEMVHRELDDRAAVRDALGDTASFREVIERADRESEEQYQCSTCNTFVYLSYIYTPGTTLLACAQHLGDLPPKGDKILRLRFDDDELTQMLHRVKARADKGGPRTASLLGAPDVDEPDQRKSGRKRVASAALRAALGEDIPFAASRAKRARNGLPAGIDEREELASVDDDDDDMRMAAEADHDETSSDRSGDVPMDGYI